MLHAIAFFCKEHGLDLFLTKWYLSPNSIWRENNEVALHWRNVANTSKWLCWHHVPPDIIRGHFHSNVSPYSWRPQRNSDSGMFLTPKLLHAVNRWVRNEPKKMSQRGGNKEIWGLNTVWHRGLNPRYDDWVLGTMRTLWGGGICKMETKFIASCSTHVNS